MGKQIKLSPGLLSLIALLLAFVLILVFIWLWYDLKNSSLEKEKQPAGTAQLAK
jgi:protein-S-isoprenylcysteine O-methyltransferase Ste14